MAMMQAQCRRCNGTGQVTVGCGICEFMDANNNVQYAPNCQYCHGNGSWSERCQWCNGTGQEYDDTETFEAYESAEQARDARDAGGYPPA